MTETSPATRTVTVTRWLFLFETKNCCSQEPSWLFAAFCENADTHSLAICIPKDTVAAKQISKWVHVNNWGSFQNNKTKHCLFELLCILAFTLDSTIFLHVLFLPFFILLYISSPWLHSCHEDFFWLMLIMSCLPSADLPLQSISFQTDFLCWRKQHFPQIYMLLVSHPLLTISWCHRPVSFWATGERIFVVHQTSGLFPSFLLWPRNGILKSV